MGTRGMVRSGPDIRMGMSIVLVGDQSVSITLHCLLGAKSWRSRHVERRIFEKFLSEVESFGDAS